MPDVASATVAAAQRGDRRAQRELYEQTAPGVFRLLVRMVGPGEAEDLTQQVYLQVFRRLPQFAGRAQFRTWLYRVAVNEALQHLRRSRPNHVSLDREPADTRPTAATARTLEQRELLERALDRLEPSLRAAFLLREVEQLSYAELAAALDVPEGTVASRLNRARRELRIALGELAGEE